MFSLYTPAYQVNGEEIAVIHTNKGTITVKLAGNDAPIHVGNFIELSQKGFYNGLKFHRHEPNFVIQGGCPHSRGMTQQDMLMSMSIYASTRFGAVGNPDLGTGGPGYCIKGEWTTNPNNVHKDGTLAMARSASPDSAGSQFYFTLSPQPYLDSGYTVFGDAVDEESLKVIHALTIGDDIYEIDILNATEPDSTVEPENAPASDNETE